MAKSFLLNHSIWWSFCTFESKSNGADENKQNRLCHGFSQTAWAEALKFFALICPLSFGWGYYSFKGFMLFFETGVVLEG